VQSSSTHPKVLSNISRQCGHIRLAVAMWSASASLRGRPNLVPLAQDACPPDGGSLPGTASAHQAGVISKHLGPARGGPQRSEWPTSKTSDIPVSQASPSSCESDTG
jgi:hypothetical protein